MVAEVAIICVTAVLITGMTFWFIERKRPVQKPLNQKELDEVREDIRKLESRLLKGNITKAFQ
jgi:hypothetical protein